MWVAKVILEGYIIVSEDDLDLVQSALPAHVELTRNEPGCIVFNVEQSQVNIHRFNVHEEFDSEASFKKHQIRVKQSRWGSITKNVQRNYNISIV